MSAFPTTVWSVIRGAGKGRDADTVELVRLYRPAVMRFARLRGLDADQAEDLAQEVFLRLFDDALLERADRERGRFRSLLLAVTRHAIGHHHERARALKRGGGVAPVPLDGLDAAAPLAEQDEFDREWFACLLTEGLRRLREKSPNAHACLKAHLLEELPQREIAARLGGTEGAVSNAIWKGRAALVEILRELARGYASSPVEHEDELRLLGRYLEESR